MDIYFITWIIIQYYIIYSIAQIIPALAIWSCCTGASDIPLLVFESTSLLSGTTRCSKLILYIPYPSFRNSHFSQESWLLLLENGIRNQKLGAKCAHCYWGVIASRPFRGQSLEICVF